MYREARGGLQRNSVNLAEFIILPCSLQGGEGWIATAIPFRSVIFPGPAGADITELTCVADRHGDERETRAKKEARRARTRTARTTYDRLGRHTTTYDDREIVLFFAQIS